MFDRSFTRVFCHRMIAATRRRAWRGLWAAGLLFQFGGCELGEITTTTTLDARELVISVVRGTILTPIDRFVTEAINNFFGERDN